MSEALPESDTEDIGCWRDGFQLAFAHPLYVKLLQLLRGERPHYPLAASSGLATGRFLIIAICVDLVKCTKMPLQLTSTLPILDLAICFARFAFAFFVEITELKRLIATELTGIASWALETNWVARDSPICNLLTRCLLANDSCIVLLIALVATKP